MAVVKSNAYGHGLLEVSNLCVGSKKVDWLGVDSIDEAMTLRRAKIKLPILVIGFIPFHRLNEAIKNNVSFVAYNIELLKYLSKNYSKILSSNKMPGAKWFMGAKLNFAENLLRFRDDRIAIVSTREDCPKIVLTYNQLYQKVLLSFQNL